MSWKDCNVCTKLRRELVKLKNDGEFRYQTDSSLTTQMIPLEVGDLYAKYPIGNREERNFKSYIDDMKICPKCHGNDVGAKYDFFPTKHYHRCICGWESEWVKGEEFESL